MINNYNYILNFGQYKGLSIKEIYQGSLNIDGNFLAAFLSEILNNAERDLWLSSNGELIDCFNISNGHIEIIGEIFDPEKPLTDANRVRIGNVENSLANFINLHFNDNFLGVLKDIKSFNKAQINPFQIGADPEYLEWCEKSVDSFQISQDCKRELEYFSIARLKGIFVLFKKDQQYEFAPKFSIETYKFNSQS